MKLNVSNELKSRLMHAAENGSVIAKDILLEVKKNVPVEEIIRGTYNCFSTKRKRTEAGTFKKIRIVFTACSKDLAHPSFPDRNNPQAPWFPENRTVLEPSTFVELFKNLPKYSPYEINYFCSALSLDSKVTVRLHESMNDFMEAYLESNYSPIADSDTSSLHSSCMRYEDKARNAADFYTNFAGAKILVARDESNNILGRAVVWNEVTLWKSINTPITAPLGISKEKFPSRSVITPFVVPFWITFAPITGIPASSTTVPVTFLSCCTPITSSTVPTEAGTAIAAFTEKAESNKQNAEVLAIH